MLGARNGPLMDEDPVGSRHRVAGGPVGYKHGMRDRMGRTTTPWDGETRGRWDWADDGMWQRGTGHGMGWETESAKQQPRGIGKPVAMVW